MIPVLVIISVFMTFALLTVTLPDATLAATTWYVKISCSFLLFSGFSSESKVPFGNLANASSVGANTVKGPSLFIMS